MFNYAFYAFYGLFYLRKIFEIVRFHLIKFDSFLRLGIVYVLCMKRMEYEIFELTIICENYNHFQKCLLELHFKVLWNLRHMRAFRKCNSVIDVLSQFHASWKRMLTLTTCFCFKCTMTSVCYLIFCFRSKKIFVYPPLITKNYTQEGRS